jgi:cardiolipin synthase
MLGKWVPVAVLVGLTGCVSLPHVDPDQACTIPASSEAAALSVMETENVGLTGTPFVAGNRVQLLVNGPQSFSAMQGAIEAAHKSIDMESYEFNGIAARQFSALLLQKRAQGVQVFLIYDAWGAMDTPSSLFGELRKGGVQVVEYSPFDPLKIISLDLNKRDHRKMLIIDGKTAFVGGVNVSPVYENRRRPVNATNDPEKLPWRDTDVRIDGPVVPIFEQLFLKTWREQTGSTPLPVVEPAGAPMGGEMVQAMDGAPADNDPAIYESLLTAIAASRQSVHLTTGFFAPPPDLAQALECAARRGVDVELIVPSRSTSGVTIAAGRSHYTALLRSGVQIYERQGLVLHAKTAVVDGVWSVVGSSNLDWRSVVYNNEIDAIILGKVFGQQLEELFKQDVLASKKVTWEAWRSRGMRERLNEMEARAIEFLL